MKLGIVTTHPIQYQVPLIREIDSRDGIRVETYYGHLPEAQQQGKGFGSSFEWDLPLLEGYSWRVIHERDGQETNENVPTCGWSAAYTEVDAMLIHGWQSWFMRRALLRGVWSDVPLLVRGDSNSMKPRSWYVRLLHRLYLQPFAKYLYVGESNRQFYRGAGVSSEDLCFSPRCVENGRFDREWQHLKGERASIRSEMGIRESAICFLFCGKFIEKKRPSEVVEAFEAARRASEIPMHLLMVGDGKLRSEAEAQVDDEAPVTFTGFLNQTEIGEAYAAADVLVLPSDYGETWGLVVNEGMIFELPAIVSDRVGCGPDLVHDEETGFTFPLGDTEKLASTMHRAAKEPEHLREMGKNARELVLSEYTLESAADGIVKAARDALSGNP
ncbi:glycosyltransferase family 4 protein [Salinibacter ruber]|nr:glycosyltransferase family 4 protein [Salinibacter ruber]